MIRRMVFVLVAFVYRYGIILQFTLRENLSKTGTPRPICRQAEVSPLKERYSSNYHKYVEGTLKNVALILNIHIRKEFPAKEYVSTYGHYSFNSKLNGAINLNRDTSRR
jgi:hypothetical protein